MGTTADETPLKQSDTESLIKSLMTDQKREVSRQTFPELEPADYEDDDTQGVVASEPEPQRKVRKVSEMQGSLKDRILGYRPTRKHIMIAAFVLIMVWRPWLIPGLIFLTFWVGLIAWLTLGPDRIMEWIGNRWDKLSVRRPDLAEKLRQRGDAFALKFDAMLDKLPDSWAEKLALPDMSKPIEAEKDLSNEPDPFEKLKLPEVYRG